MTRQNVQVGNGTHTGQMLGYCPDCGLYHGSAPARAACMDLMTAESETPAEAVAWRALKDAIDLERVGPITRASRDRDSAA